MSRGYKNPFNFNDTSNNKTIQKDKTSWKIRESLLFRIPSLNTLIIYLKVSKQLCPNCVPTWTASSTVDLELKRQISHYNPAISKKNSKISDFLNVKRITSCCWLTCKIPKSTWDANYVSLILIEQEVTWWCSTYMWVIFENCRTLHIYVNYLYDSYSIHWKASILFSKLLYN